MIFIRLLIYCQAKFNTQNFSGWPGMGHFVLWKIIFILGWAGRYGRHEQHQHIDQKPSGFEMFHKEL